MKDRKCRAAWDPHLAARAEILRKRDHVVQLALALGLAHREAGHARDVHGPVEEHTRSLLAVAPSAAGLPERRSKPCSVSKARHCVRQGCEQDRLVVAVERLAEAVVDDEADVALVDLRAGPDIAGGQRGGEG